MNGSAPPGQTLTFETSTMSISWRLKHGLLAHQVTVDRGLLPIIIKYCRWVPSNENHLDTGIYIC